MLSSFDHVTIGKMEFVLHYRHIGDPVIDNKYPEWHAIDVYGNEVIIREKLMVKLPPMAYDGNTRLFQPTFYRVSEDSSHRIKSIFMDESVASGVQSGSYLDHEGCQWYWDINKRIITSNSQKYRLKVFSTGGWWI